MKENILNGKITIKTIYNTHYLNSPANIDTNIIKEMFNAVELQEYFKDKLVTYMVSGEFIIFCNPELPPVCIKKSNL